MQERLSALYMLIEAWLHRSVDVHWIFSTLLSCCRAFTQNIEPDL